MKNAVPSVNIKGTEVVYNDLLFPLIPKATGAGNPSLATLVGNLQAYAFAVNDAIQCESSELLHFWKEGTQISFHVHWATGGTDAAETGVKWEIEYAWSDINGVFSSSTTISAEETIAANTTAKTHLLTAVGTYTPSGGKIGSQLAMRLKRITAAGTAPAANPLALQVGVHVQMDTLGSRQIATK